MEKINFVNNGQPYINDTNLNALQDNAENAIAVVNGNINTAKQEVLDYFNFSTTEKQVGTWFDGKPLYRKCFQYDVSGTSLEVSHNIANVDNIWYDLGHSFFISGSSWFLTLGHYASSTDWSRFHASRTTLYSTFGTTYNSVTKHVYATILYTKTTD